MSADRKPLTAAELMTRIVVTVPEYAATFFADERTVRRGIKDGQIVALQIGDTWRIPVAPLLKQCRIDPQHNSEAASPTDTATAPTPTLLKRLVYDNDPAA